MSHGRNEAMFGRAAASLRAAALLPLAAAALALPLAAARAAGDRALGEYLASECAACHLSSGRQVGGVPAIVGFTPEQFVALMRAYKERQRPNPAMQAIAARLSDEEIAALAAYYAGLTPGP